MTPSLIYTETMPLCQYRAASPHVPTRYLFPIIHNVTLPNAQQQVDHFTTLLWAITEITQHLCRLLVAIPQIHVIRQQLRVELFKVFFGLSCGFRSCSCAVWICRHAGYQSVEGFVVDVNRIL